MKKFKFSLQTVHGLRERKREQEEQKLADLNHALSAATERLIEIEKARQAATEQYAQKIQNKSFSVFEMALNVDYLKVLAHQEQTAREQVAEARRACQQQSQVLANAAQAAKVTDKLHDKQRARYDLEVARTQQNEIDEMVTLRFARQFN